MASSPQKDTLHSEPNEIDLSIVISCIVREKRTIVYSIVSSLLVCLLYLLSCPPTYESTTLIEVQLPGDSTNIETVKTVERLLQRESLFRRVLKNPIVIANEDLQEIFIKNKEPVEQVLKIEKWSHIRQLKDTRLIAVSARLHLPKAALDLSSAIVYEYRQEQKELRDKPSDSPLGMIYERSKKYGATSSNTLLLTPINIVDKAYLPISPIKPDKLKTLATAIILGLFIGLFIVWARQTLDFDMITRRSG